MADLLTLVREYDLPLKWDGRRVVWRGWTDPYAGVFICGRRGATNRTVCTGCGSTEPCVMNIGTVHPLPDETFTSRPLVERTTKSGRVYVKDGAPVTRAAWPVIRLCVFRCPGCKQDSVWDTTTGEWWDLDHTDYGPEGSNAP